MAFHTGFNQQNRFPQVGQQGTSQFIAASGFSIEKIIDTKVTTVSKQAGTARIFACSFGMKDNGLDTVDGNKYKRGKNDCYYLKASMSVDYKVTKKGFMSCVIDDWKDLTDCEKLMILKEEIKQLQEVPCEKD